MSTEFSSIWPIDRTLSGATTPDQSGPGSDANKEVLRIPKISSCLTAQLRFNRWILQPQATGSKTFEVNLIFIFFYKYSPSVMFIQYI